MFFFFVFFFSLSGYLRTSPIGKISYIHSEKPICFVLFWLYRCNRRDIFVFCFGMFSWITIFMRVSFKALFFWQNLSSMTPSLKQNHFFRPLDINVCFEGNFCLKNVFVQNFTDPFKRRPVYLLIPTCVFSYCWCCSVKQARYNTILVVCASVLEAFPDLKTQFL